MKAFFKKLILGKPNLEQKSTPKGIDHRKRNVKSIWENEHHNDIGLEKIVRLLLASSQFLFPGSYIKHYFEKKGVHYKDLAVDALVLAKVCFPIFILKFQLEHNSFFFWFQIWLVLETILYIPTLIFASDSMTRTRSYRRSMLLVFLNYIEIILAFAVFYASGDHLNKPLDNWYDSVYFSFTTAYSMGLGDFHPVTPFGKLLVCIQAILFLLFVVIFLNFFSNKVESKGYFE
ncbi:MAG: two pore domain potassium channel family protein [Saprospiraceae bacterium]|nr:two pore domain potassium channel family protein [Saprospiraceae bacterium]